jgi:NTE family protein
MIQCRRRRSLAWSELGRFDFSEFGLVLGAGGATGAAFEAGILLALSVDHGVRLSDASTVIGTSVGAIGASLVTLGFEAHDIAAVVTENPIHLSPSAARHGATFATDLPPLPPLRAMFRVPTPHRAVRTAKMLLAGRVSSSLLPFLRTGTLDFAPYLDFLSGATWPIPPGCLKICATDLMTGARVVFDGTTDVPLASAVAASCAVPAVMRPVAADGRLCVDGAMSSPTNADLLVGDEAAPDLIVVISPMSGRRARTMAGAMSAGFAGRRLSAELRKFHSGQRVIVVEPAETLSELVVDDALSRGSSRRIVGSAFVGASA